MTSNHTNYKARLNVAPETTPLEIRLPSTFPLPGEALFHSPPALPRTLLQLEWALSATVADLQEITNIIRSDIGLTAQLLRLAARETGVSLDRFVAIDEIVVNVGLEKLRALAAATGALPPDRTSRAGLSARERFWMHSRLTALVAEELAGRSSEIRPDHAYLGGLLCHLGDLSSLLDPISPDSDAAVSRQIGYRMANAWGFPHHLAEVIGGDREVCLTRESRVLLDIVTAADVWAFRLESLAARESKRPRPRIHLVD
jgi:HD-like signal output (HDOD) protein